MLRLRYRYLDMRGERMQRNLRLNHTIISAIRREMDALGFVDVWTPSMTKGTPEGARDFLVPVRLQPGKFYALAQSPQLFKQLTMVGGLDRYYQIATCWRDEDLRADRQFEFRQLDLEMSFVDRDDVLDVMERAVVAAFEGVGREPPPRPFPRVAYAEAIARYGSDKPDFRFGLEIEDATELTRGSEFGVFASAPRRSLPRRAAGVLARRARAPRGDREGVGCEGARVSRRATSRARCARRSRSSSPRRSSPRSPASPGRRRSSPPATRTVVARVLGGLRTHLGRELGLAETGAELFHWIVDFPLFQRDEDTGEWTFLHHPFTAAVPGRRGQDREPTRARR